MSNCRTSIKGQVKVQVIDHLGRVVRDYPEQPNLLLDQGMNNFADVLYCDLFKYAAKGNSSEAMKEAVTGTYSLASGAATVTRITGSRSFTSADIGKLIRTTNVTGTGSTQVECIIQSITSTTVAHVIPVGDFAVGTGSVTGSLTDYTGKIIALYSVQLTGLNCEDSRSSSYSNVAGENSTVDAGAVRNFKRTFLFDPEPQNKTLSASSSTPTTATWAATAKTVTRIAGTRDFVAGDVGKYLKFLSTGEYCKILTRTSATVVTVDRDPAALITADSFEIYGYNSYSHIGFSDIAEGAAVEHSDDPYAVVHSSDTSTRATWSSTAVTRTAGTRDFTSGDVGRRIRFADSQEFCKIVTITSVSVVQVDRSPSLTITSAYFDLYSVTTGSWSATAGTVVRTSVSDTHVRDFTSADIGKFIRFHSTGEFCKILTISSTATITVDRNPSALIADDFFDLHATAPTLNIMVRLETTGSPTPVLALGANPEVAGQQVKVTYTTQITFFPGTAAFAFADVFSGDKSAMGGGAKTGTLTIEGMATTRINTDGETDSSATGLEPSSAGYVALSPSSAALVPVASGNALPDRSAGLSYVDLVPDDYSTGSFSRTSTGTFGINDGNGNLWRTFGIYDPNDRLFLLTCLWAAVQKKPATHQFSLHFRKTWNRDLQ